MDVPLPRSQVLAQRAVARHIDGKRGRLLRFLSARLGGAVESERFLCDALLLSLQEPDKLRRGECLPAWLDRKTLRALEKWSESRPMSARDPELSRGEQGALLGAVRLCLSALLRGLKPRYEHVLRRVDLGAESKLIVARDLKLSRSTMDVLLYRARQAMRRRLERFCVPEAGVPTRRGPVLNGAGRTGT